MSKRRAAKVKEDVDDNYDADDTSARNDDDRGKTKSTKKEGYNIYAIVIIAMFVVPGIIGATLYVIDYMYPEAAATRKFKEKIMNCYEIANPTKLSDVDKFIAKYQGRETALYAQLRNKYRKVPECQLY